MARYVTRARIRSDDFDWSDDIPRPSTVEVVERDPVDTGLLDIHGNSIWRMNDPIGFRISN